MNNASGGERIEAVLLNILKNIAVKGLQAMCQQLWKILQWPQNWKNQFPSQSQRRTMTKNIQTTTPLCSFLM